jgi:hypothetical protein
MKKALKNSEILGLYKSLKNLPPSLSGARFLYALNRSAELMKPVAKPLEEVERKLMNFRQTDKGMIKYEEERIELVKTFARVDESGQPLTKSAMIGGARREVYDVPEERQEDLEKANELLQKKHKKAFDAEKKMIEDFEKLLEESSEFSYHEVPLELIPEDIQAGLFAQVFHIIKPEE